MATTTNPLILYTSSTPNGRRVSVLLEELKAIYGLQYDLHPFTLSKGNHREPWFIALNPNGRIPVLVDRTRAGGFTVTETSAIQLYLSQHFDKYYKLSWHSEEDPKEYSEMLQWIFWVHGGLGPAQMEGSHFHHSAPEDIPYAKKRFLNEIKRHYNVLQVRLQDRDWLVGEGRGKYSIADINAACWVRSHAFAGIETLDEWPAVKAWLESVSARPAFKVGVAIPN